MSKKDKNVFEPNLTESLGILVKFENVNNILHQKTFRSHKCLKQDKWANIKTMPLEHC